MWLMIVEFARSFAKSVSRLKVIFLKASSFNEIVTMDLKSFGSKHVFD